MTKPAVVFAPRATSQLKRGFDQMGRLLAGTLGPSQGITIATKDIDGSPEILTDAATIARRVMAIPGREQDVGAMILRQMVWRMNERIGDGSATTAVMAQSLLTSAHRLLTAGLSLVEVQHGIRQAAEAAISELRRMAQPADEWETLATVGQAVTGRQELGDVIGEMVDILGPDNHVTIEDFMSPMLERVYIEGGRWMGKIVSPYLINAPAGQKSILTDVHVAAVAEQIHATDALIPLLQIVNQTKSKNLLIVGFEFSEDVQKALVGTHSNRKNDIHVSALKLNRGGVYGSRELEDLVLAVGGEVIGPEKGTTLAQVIPQHLGRAERVETSRDFAVVQGGNGDAQVRQAEIERLVSYIETVDFTHDDFKRLKERLARLKEQTAILKIGTHSKTERRYLHQMAEQGVKSVSLAARGGVVPGGGTAYLHAISAVQALAETLPVEPRSGALAVSEMLASPFQQILRNAGVRVPEIPQEDLLSQPVGAVYDVMRGEFVSAAESGLLDPVEVLIAALETAVSGALMAMSVEAIVLQKKPELSFDP